MKLDKGEDLKKDVYDNRQRFVTMDDTWVHHLQPERNQQTKPWKHLCSLPAMGAKTGMYAGKVTASSFWDAEGVLLVDYLDKAHTIAGAYYADLLRQLRGEIMQIRRGKLFHQYNVLTHVRSGQECYTEMWIPTCRIPTLF